MLEALKNILVAWGSKSALLSWEDRFKEDLDACDKLRLFLQQLKEESGRAELENRCQKLLASFEKQAIDDAENGLNLRKSGTSMRRMVEGALFFLKLFLTLVCIVFVAICIISLTMIDGFFIFPEAVRILVMVAAVAAGVYVIVGVSR